MSEFIELMFLKSLFVIITQIKIKEKNTKEKKQNHSYHPVLQMFGFSCSLLYACTML